MATIIWNNDEKTAVISDGMIEFSENGEQCEIDESKIESELDRLNVEYDAIQFGIKYKYAWQVDQDGNI